MHQPPPSPSAQSTLPSRTASLVLALLTAGAGVVTVLSPLLPWATSVFGGGSATGLRWFEENLEDEGADSFFREHDLGEGGADWVLNPMPDGIPLLVLGAGLTAVAVLTVVETRPGRATSPSRGELAAAHGTAVCLSGFSLLWVVISYGHFRDLYGGLVELGTGLALAFLAILGAGAASGLAFLLLFLLRGSSSASPGLGTTSGGPAAAAAGESVHG